MKAWKRDQKRLQAELHALRGFVEARFGEIKGEIKRLMGGMKRAPVPAAEPTRPAPVSRPATPSARAPRKATAPAGDAIEALEAALNAHAHKQELATAAGQRDQLLRSLIPLYLARGVEGLKVNSGAISRFWRAHGVRYAGPNAAKALRGKPGHAKKSGTGWVITDAGVKYVEAALTRAE